MKVKVRKLKKVNSKAYARAALIMPIFARVHNSFDIALSRREEKQNFAEKCVQNLLVATRQVRFECKFAVRENLLAAIEDARMQSRGILEMLKLPFKNLAAVSLVAVLLLQMGGFTVLKTFAYFTSTATSANQDFSAGTLDISVSPAVFDAGTMVAGNSISSDFTISNVGNLPFKYTAKTVITSIDPTLCDGLNVTATNGSNTYSAALKDFVSSPVILDSGLDTTWNFALTLPFGSTADLQNQTCGFDWVFDAWQTNLPDNTQGFTDSAEIVGSAGSGKWIPDPVHPGDIIINEIMWMGSEDNNGNNSVRDEWIELRNTTDHDLVVNNWNIYGAVSGASGHLEIPNGYVIPAYSYFLISNKDKGSSAINVDVQLKDTSINFDNEYNQNGQLILTNKVTTIVYDKTPVPNGTKWPKGINENGKKWSMERNLDPGDGTDVNNWHTCDPTIMSTGQLNLMKSYWDNNANQFNCGTPGAENLSKNDPTAPDYDPSLVTDESPISMFNTFNANFVQQGSGSGEDVADETPAGSETVDTGTKDNNDPALTEEKDGSETSGQDKTLTTEPEKPAVEEDDTDKSDIEGGTALNKEETSSETGDSKSDDQTITEEQLTEEVTNPDVKQPDAGTDTTAISKETVIPPVVDATEGDGGTENE